MSIDRIVGSRGQRPIGPLRAPTPEEYAWSQRMGQRRTRVPKGVFRYRSMEEANADWERWHVDMVAATARNDAPARSASTIVPATGYTRAPALVTSLRGVTHVLRALRGERQWRER